MDTTGYWLGRALARFFNAVFGVLPLIGPFVLFLFRGLSLGLVVMFLIFAAGYAYAWWSYRKSGLSYLRELASDTLTAMAAAIGGAGASIVLASFTRIRLHAHALFLPAVVVGFFWYLEYRAARHRAAAPRRATWLGRAEDIEAKKKAENAAVSLKKQPWSAPGEIPARSSKP
ncbi:MAG TPA: hypothetical protein VGA73_02740 [Candidatus Binatia bacterium]